MNKIITISAIVATMLFVGCGGSSSSSSADSNATESNSTNSGNSEGNTSNSGNSDANTTNSENSEGNTTAGSTNQGGDTTLTNSSYVSGIYDLGTITTNGTDQAYLVIANTGLLTTYLYNTNCYQKNPSTLNSTLNGKQLTSDEGNKRFTLGGYYWTYGNTTKIQRVSYGDSISAGTILSMNGTKIATSQALTTTVTTQELENNICK